MVFRKLGRAAALGLVLGAVSACALIPGRGGNGGEETAEADGEARPDRRAMRAQMDECENRPSREQMMMARRMGMNPAELCQDAPPEEDRIPVLALDEIVQVDPQYASYSISVPPAFANAAWSQPGGEADHVMHHLSGPNEPSLSWSTRIGEGGTRRSPLTSPPVIAAGRAYAIDAEAVVRAFDTDDGSVIWRRSLTPDLNEGRRRFWQIAGRTKPSEIGFGGGSAYDGGRLFVSSGFGFVAGLDAVTGEPLWQTELDAPVRNPPSASDGQVYVITTSNQVVALDQRTGEVTWTYESFEETARFLSTASPAVDGDMVVVPFSSGELVALDRQTGRLLWAATIARSSRLNALSNLSDIAGSPVIDRGAVFAVSHSGQLSAVDGRTGQVVWEVPVGGLNMPWVAGNYLFVLSVTGDLIALTRNEGAVIWKTELPKFESPQKQLDPITWFGPILVDDHLVLTSSHGRMIEVSPQNGETISTVKLDRGTSLPPVVADGTLYIVTGRGRLQAWR